MWKLESTQTRVLVEPAVSAEQPGPLRAACGAFSPTGKLCLY